jgi:hypothetical protein
MTDANIPDNGAEKEAVEKSSLTDVIKIEYIGPDNAEFTVKNGYIGIKLDRPVPEEEPAEETPAGAAATAAAETTTENEAAEAAEKPDEPEKTGTDEKPEKLEKPYRITEDGRLEYDRVFLHRCFPNELSEGYVSVLDRDGAELGMIRSIDDFPEETRELLRLELGRKYHFFTIKSVRSVNEKYGYSYWKITDEAGEREFTVRDTYRNITKVSEDRVFVTDVDGNRFEIPSLSALDRRSRRKIELFL